MNAADKGGKKAIIPAKAAEPLPQQYIVPGNEVSVEEAKLEKIIQPREVVYSKYLQMLQLLDQFLFVDLELYEQFNYKQIGDKTSKFSAL